MDMKQEPRQLNVVFLFETKLNSIHVFYLHVVPLNF
jgi:hypothetical protein